MFSEQKLLVRDEGTTYHVSRRALLLNMALRDLRALLASAGVVLFGWSVQCLCKVFEWNKVTDQVR